MTNEIWRPIQGHEGYEVSDLGRVRSIDRIVNRVFRNGRVVPTRYTGRILKLSPSGPGYPTLKLRGWRGYVHQVVLETFVGPRPAGHYAAHGDGNRMNNALANLRWATPKANAADKILHGTAMFGTRNPMGRKTHCKWGHPFDLENTRRRPDGRRACRTCAREWQRRRAAAVATVQALATAQIDRDCAAPRCQG